MPWSRWIPLALLCATALLLALWASVETARRSTIPLALDAVLLRQEMRPEKHPGLDDVCLLHLSDGRVLHVDTAVYHALHQGEHLRKAPGQRTLQHDQRVCPLVYSDECETQWAASLVAALSALALAGRAARGTRGGGDTPASPGR